jgi:hypothetical protein
MMHRIAFGVALCAGLAPAAGAQSPLRICVVSPPSFATNSGNRLNCQSIDALGAAQTLVFQRPDRRRSNCEFRYTVPPDRGDGSFAVIARGRPPRPDDGCHLLLGCGRLHARAERPR